MLKKYDLDAKIGVDTDGFILFLFRGAPPLPSVFEADAEFGSVRFRERALQSSSILFKFNPAQGFHFHICAPADVFFGC